MQIILWRLWSGLLFAAILIVVPAARQPAKAEAPAAQDGSEFDVPSEVIR